MSQAQEFAARYSNPGDLMTAMAVTGVKADQDWFSTWTFEDGSTITVGGPTGNTVTVSDA